MPRAVIKTRRDFRGGIRLPPRAEIKLRLNRRKTAAILRNEAHKTAAAAILRNEAHKTAAAAILRRMAYITATVGQRRKKI